jgi:hypothetical protein
LLAVSFDTGDRNTRPTQPTELENKGEIIMNPQDETQDTAQTTAHNAFPEPQTIPSGWDTSEFSPATQPIPNPQGDESNESETN